MRYLLDTHTFLWALAEPERLSSTARACLEKSSNELWVSAVTFFEVTTKVRSGKLKVSDDTLARWEWILSRLNARPLALTVRDAILAGQWSVPHRDPFDRLLAAQAVNESLDLVSCDAIFLQGFGDLKVVW